LQGKNAEKKETLSGDGVHKGPKILHIKCSHRRGVTGCDGGSIVTVC